MLERNGLPCFNHMTPYSEGCLFPDLMDNSPLFLGTHARAPSIILLLALRYVDKLEKIFQNAPTDPTQDFSTQVYVARSCVQPRSLYAFVLLHDHLEWAAVQDVCLWPCCLP